MTPREQVTVTVTPAGDAVNLDRDPTVKVDPGQTSTVTGQGQGSGQGQGQVQRHRDPDPDRSTFDPRRWFARRPVGHGQGQGQTSTVTPDLSVPAPARKGRGQGWAALGRWVAILAVTGIATWMAGTGQVDVWAWAGLPHADPRRFGVPFDMELAFVAWMFIGQYAAHKKMSPWPYWSAGLVFAAIAVYTNSVHGTWRQSLIFGTASALTVALWFAHFYIDYAGSEIDQERRAGTRPKVLFTPAAITDLPLRWRAFLLVNRFGQIQSVEDALTKADLWRWVYQDTKATRGRLKGRRVARRTAWHTVARELGVKVIQPQGITIAEVTFAAPPVPVRPAPRPPVITRTEPAEPPAEQPSNTPTSPAPAEGGSRKQDPRETYPEIFGELDKMSTGDGWVPTDGNVIAAALKAGVPCPSKGTRQQKIRAAYKDAA